MKAKYHKLMNQDEEGVTIEDDHQLQYTSAFTYSSIFTYDNSKMFKSPYTYDSFSKPTKNSLQLEKDNKNSLTRSILETVVIVWCYGMLLMAFPLSLLFCLRFVSKFERLVVFRLGRLQDAKGPGAVMVLPCIDSYKRIDMRTKAFNIPPLQAITSDGGVVEFGATVFYRVKDALASVLNVQDFNKALRNLAHSVMHRLVNKHDFQTIEKDRKPLRDELQAELNKAAFGWGMEVGNIDMSEMRVLRQPEPRSNNALRTLMQPQVMSTLWKAISGKESGPSQVAGTGIPMEFETGPAAAAHFQEIMKCAAPPAATDDLTKLVNFIQSALSDSLGDEVGRSFQIECRGLGDFYMHLKKPLVCVGVGRIEEADVTISLERQDLIDLLSEKLAPLDAYLSGRISITGDPQAALQMQPLVVRLRPFLRANALSGVYASQPSKGEMGAGEN